MKTYLALLLAAGLAMAQQTPEDKYKALCTPQSQQQDTSNGGVVFDRKCDTAGNLGTITPNIGDPDDCMELCANDSACKGVSWAWWNSDCFLDTGTTTTQFGSMLWRLKQNTSPAPAPYPGPNAVCQAQLSLCQNDLQACKNQALSNLPAICKSKHGNDVTFNNQKYRVDCNNFHLNSDKGAEDANSLQECLELCDRTAGCNQASWNSDVLICLMSSAQGPGTNSDPLMQNIYKV